MSARRLPAPLSVCLQAGAAQRSCCSLEEEADGNGPSTLSSVCGRKVEVRISASRTQSVLGVGLETCFMEARWCHCWVLAVVKYVLKYAGGAVIHGY